MHILWDCRSVAPFMGGIGRATIGWLNAFLNQCGRVSRVSAIFSNRCDENFLKSIISAKKEVTIHIVAAGLIDPIFENIQLPTLIQQQAVDIYFNPCFSIPAIKTSRAQIAVVHDTVFLDEPDWVDPHLRKYLSHSTELAMRRADKILTVSRFSQNRLNSISKQKNWPERNISIIHPAIDNQNPKHPSSLLIPDLPNRYILYLGAIERKKGIEVLLDAFEQIVNRKMIEGLYLVLAGGTGGQAFDLHHALAQRNILHRTKVMGAVDESVKSYLYSKASIFVFPSLYEGFGIPPLEAMKAGVPVIASRSTSLPEVLGDAALLIHPESSEDLVNAINRILSSKELSADLVKKGRIRSTHFKWENAAETLIKEFAQISR